MNPGERPGRGPEGTGGDGRSLGTVARMWTEAQRRRPRVPALAVWHGRPRTFFQAPPQTQPGPEQAVLKDLVRRNPSYQPKQPVPHDRTRWRAMKLHLLGRGARTTWPHGWYVPRSSKGPAANV